MPNARTTVPCRMLKTLARPALAVVFSIGIGGCGGGGSGGGAQVTIVPDPQTLEEVPQAPPVSTEEAPPVSAEEFPNPVALVPSSTQTGPDLVAGNTGPGYSGLLGEEFFRLSARVRNAGDRASPATMATLYRSIDARITRSDTPASHYKVLGLSPGDSRSLEMSRLSAPWTPGTYYYGICVNEVEGESNTANNCGKSVRITVRQAPAPDLVVTSPSASPAGPAAGGLFAITVTVRNAGRSVKPIWLRFYRSDDTTFTASDPQVGSYWARGGLASNSRFHPWKTLDVPDDFGVYYYRACADVAEGESNTANNCSPALKVEVTHAKPNLRIPVTHSAEPKSGSPDGRFKMGANVMNMGGPAPATTLRFYRSTDKIFTSSDTEVGSLTVPALRKTRSQTIPWFTTDWVYDTPPSSGTHHYGACLDAVPDESDTTDNCKFVRTIWR